MSPFKLVHGLNLGFFPNEYLSEHSSTLEDRLLEALSMKSSRISCINKKKWHGGLVDEKVVKRFNLGDIFLVGHGRVVGTRVKCQHGSKYTTDRAE